MWARRRLSDKDGRKFSVEGDQDGVLLADGVGMGKTWEALAGAALILYSTRPVKGRRHILITCPANLITKWEDELSAGSPFRTALDRWVETRQSTRGRRYAERIRDTLQYVLPIRRSRQVPTRRKFSKFQPPEGTYVVSHDLIAQTGRGSSRRGLNALRRQEWDVLIVDEAHHTKARKAIDALETRRGHRAGTKILMSATPFQLEPAQWNDLARHLVKRHHRLLKLPEVEAYVREVARTFDDESAPGPSRRQVRTASETLRKISVRTIPQVSNRTYSLLLADGKELALGRKKLDEYDDTSLRELLDQLRQYEHGNDKSFEREYFLERLRLARGNDRQHVAESRGTDGRAHDRTHVSTTLRRFLAKGTPAAPSPRLKALSLWAQAKLAEDMRAALDLQDGRDKHLPRKLIVFTSWVGKDGVGEAGMLKRMLTAAYERALDKVRETYGDKWEDWVRDGREEIRRLAAEKDWEVEQGLLERMHDDLTRALAGRHPSFVCRLRKNLKARLEAFQRSWEEPSTEFERHALKRRQDDMWSALAPWGRRPQPVERYTGRDTRSDRDRVATAFRDLGQPWVLVASNVGAEGIDLQTYTHRIVHYDLEWNPAKMEQREGRGDRVGRELESPLSVLYCIVPRTYDERMFHQVVARDRWHGVLLGKPATALADDEKEAPLRDKDKLRRMRLDLSPGK